MSLKRLKNIFSPFHLLIFGSIFIGSAPQHLFTGDQGHGLACIVISNSSFELQKFKNLFAYVLYNL